LKESFVRAWEHKVVPAGFALAGALFLVAALKPAVTGQSLNATFFVLGVVFLVLGFVLLRKRGGGPTPPSA
jgi:LPXTG-motif cell wall-anchored protein